jgi:hypothetical protein
MNCGNCYNKGRKGEGKKAASSKQQATSNRQQATGRQATRNKVQGNVRCLFHPFFCLNQDLQDEISG